MERTYEPPLSKNGEILTPGAEPEIWPGVRGYAVEHSGRIFIPAVAAENEGSGDVGRFLDAVSERCVFPNVMSARLRGMLRRRGFRVVYDVDGECDVWRR